MNSLRNSRADMAEMTVEQIRDRIAVLQREKDAIKAQVDEAKRIAAADGRFADPLWLTDAESAMRARGRNIGRLQVELGARLRAERQQRHASTEAQALTFERIFMRKARELLPAALYDQVFNEAVEAAR